MTDADVLEIATLLYSKWAVEMQRVLDVQIEQNDGSKDWALFHADRLNAARLSESKYRGLKDRFLEEHREVLSRQ